MGGAVFPSAGNRTHRLRGETLQYKHGLVCLLLLRRLSTHWQLD
ncbi:MAG: hypothetical protein QW190_05530 [Thermoproteota archaeon]